MINGLLVFSVLALNSVVCPGLTGHVTFKDYDGDVTFESCVGAFQFTSTDVYITLYNPDEDGIFRNGFD